VIVVGLALEAVGMAWIGLIAAPDLAYARLVAPIILAGSGALMAMPAARNTTLSSVSEFEVGKAPGPYYRFRSGGGMSGVAVVVAIFAGTGGFASVQAFSAGFVAAIGVGAVLSLLGAIAGILQPARTEVVVVAADAKACDQQGAVLDSR
jgi:hypothetical protein